MRGPVLVTVLALFACGGCAGTSMLDSPDRVELAFQLLFPQEVPFDREMLNITYDDGTGAKIITGEDFSGPRPTQTETVPAVTATGGETSVHIEILQDGILIGEADEAVSQAPGTITWVRISVGHSDPVPCFDCIGWQEVGFTGGDLSVETFWVIQVRAPVEPDGRVS